MDQIRSLDNASSTPRSARRVIGAAPTSAYLSAQNRAPGSPSGARSSLLQFAKHLETKAISIDLVDHCCTTVCSESHTVPGFRVDPGKGPDSDCWAARGSRTRRAIPDEDRPVRVLKTIPSEFVNNRTQCKSIALLDTMAHRSHGQQIGPYIRRDDPSGDQGGPSPKKVTSPRSFRVDVSFRGIYTFSCRRDSRGGKERRKKMKPSAEPKIEIITDAEQAISRTITSLAVRVTDPRDVADKIDRYVEFGFVRGEKRQRGRTVVYAIPSWVQERYDGRAVTVCGLLFVSEATAAASAWFRENR